MIIKLFINFEVFVEDIIDDKVNVFNIEVNIKLSFFGGLVNV